MTDPVADPVPSLTLPQFIRQQARRWPGALALTDARGEHALSYDGLARQIGRCAAGLAAAGLRPGDTLLICSDNTPAWVVVALAAMAAGARVGGADPACSAAELAYQVHDADARFVYTQAALLAGVRQAAALARTRYTVVVDGEAPDTLAYADLLACTAAEPEPSADADLPALLPYPARPGGLPKGEMLSHRTLVTHLRQLRQAGGCGPGSVLLARQPMSRAVGHALATLGGLACGARVVTLPPCSPPPRTESPFMNRIPPSKFVHVAYRTRRFDAMVAWYAQVFGARVQHRDPALAFLTYDDEHHRFAFINLDLVAPGVPEPERRGLVGVEHTAYTHAGLAHLFDQYEQLAAQGIRPYWCVHHGITVSMYYADPDGNQIEFQVERYASADEANAFMTGADFALNPIGVEFDPDDWLARLRAGTPADALLPRHVHLPVSPVRGAVANVLAAHPM